MRQALMMWVVLPAVMLLASGCVATRGWVREHVDKTEVAMDKKVSAVDQKSAAESQRLDQKVDGVDGRLKTTEGNLAETTATAKGAKERADSAYTKADETNSRLTRLWTNRNNRKEADSYQILFGFDKWEIGDAGQTKLSELVREMKENPKLTVDLQGYADPVGSYGYNVALSQRRVESVRRYLVEKGVELPRINLIGLGPIAEKGVANKDKRKVTVKMMVNAED